jgi:hypothetical protein
MNNLVELPIELGIELKTVRMRDPSNNQLITIAVRAGALRAGPRGTAQPCLDFATAFCAGRANFPGAGQFHPLSGNGSRSPMKFINHLQKKLNGCIIAPHQRIKEPSPMWIRADDRSVQRSWNWFAIFSYTASLALSLAIWRSVFRAVEHLIK